MGYWGIFSGYLSGCYCVVFPAGSCLRFRLCFVSVSSCELMFLRGPVGILEMVERLLLFVAFCCFLLGEIIPVLFALRFGNKITTRMTKIIVCER